MKIDIVAFWKEIFKMNVAPLCMVIVSYFVLQNVVLDSPIRLGVGIVVYLLVYLPLFYFGSMNAYERDLVTKPIRKILKFVLKK